QVTHVASGQLRGVWSVRDLPVPDGYLAALAVAGAAVPRVSVRHVHLGSAWVRPLKGGVNSARER
ncbi:hypothetical protein, partial [Streptomyces sp. WM6386]|uniref:hypothetical protein n=1 Tax=Streptomyces sp. WM6386 TaxID=1415558 RepID=UPI0006196BF9